MAIVVNTNMSALKTQRNLSNATNGLNKALERMSTGYKINSAKDDAAGMFIASNLKTQISGLKIAKSNIETGQNLLDTTEGVLDAIAANVNRIRDLAVQASNGIYDTASRTAMGDEITERLAEITRLQSSAKFNGLELFSTAAAGKLSQDGLRVQVGANNDAAGATTLIYAIELPGTNFTTLSVTPGNFAVNNVASAQTAIGACDTLLTTINNRKSAIGAVGSRLDSAKDSVTTSIENFTAAYSTIMDADIAEESAEYTKQQILQQTSASLLAQANQLPSIALTLVRG